MNKIIWISLVASTIVFAGEISTGFVPLNDGVKSVKVNLNDTDYEIIRNQNKNNPINPVFGITDRGALQPIIIDERIQTVGELEVIDFMKKMTKDPENYAIIDARKSDWFDKSRIPGAINMPFPQFGSKDSASMFLEDLNVTENEGVLNFDNAKNIVVYCNGFSCRQSAFLIKEKKFSLLNLGYPAEKILYYRGGMQAWETVGLTVEK